MPRFPLLSSLAAVVLSACASVPEPNPPDGFVSLFNGKNLDGWRGFVAPPTEVDSIPIDEYAVRLGEANARAKEHWTVENGVLVFDGKGENLCTAADFGDFELLLDWRIENGGDSGVYLRGTPQVQIWDNPIGSGGLYNNQHHPSQPLVVADRPVGEWNTFRIRMIDDRVSVWLNGELVVDDVVMENYWEPDRPVYATGPIELQAHQTPLWFRNIYIRPIELDLP